MKRASLSVLAVLGAVAGACQTSGSPSSPGSAGSHGGKSGSEGAGTGGASGGANGGEAAGASGTAGATGTGGFAGGTVTGGTSGGGAAAGGASGAAGTGGGSTAGAGGPGGSGGGTATGTGGSASPDGGTHADGGNNSDGWVNIMPVDETLKDANGITWFPYVKGYTPGMDPLKTFRFDSTTGYLNVTYADYPNSSFDMHLGLLYYDKKLTNYKVRVEYRFQEPQAKNPVSWGKNNSGLFVFGTDPHMITGNPDFPTAIEIQLLGNPSAGGNINCQICLNSTVGMYPAKIGTMNISAAGGCFKSTQSPSDFQAAATWTTVEADVVANGTTNIYQYAQDGTKPASPIQTFAAPVKTGGQTVTGGWMSLQSESQPVQFRKVELMEMP